MIFARAALGLPWRNIQTKLVFRAALATLLLALATLASSISQASTAGLVRTTSCEIGSYRMSDGSALDIGPGEPGQLRWRSTDGQTGALRRVRKNRWSSTYGWTKRDDGHRLSIHCGSGQIRFDSLIGQRETLIQIDTRFQSNGVELAGRLSLPAGNAKVPIVVLIHGAEHSSALDNYSLQRQFASAGIGVFAYDKRGTGASAGRYTQNYLLLAIDAIHATHEARRLAAARAGQIGYQAGSQGGWVAPLAAQIEPVDFIIVSFGLAVSPLEEDREAIEFDMARAGFDAEVTAEAMQLADASAIVVESNFRQGFDQLEALKRKYGNEPWFSTIRGNYSGFVLTESTDTLRKQGPELVEGISLRYDPMPVLRNLTVPQLWLFGGEDRDAPPGETLRRLAALQDTGRPISCVIFPDADHGMYEFEIGSDRARVSTRQPSNYFTRMKNFILKTRASRLKTAGDEPCLKWTWRGSSRTAK